MIAPGLIDAVAREPVIVTGSLPPGGRDLDLLVTPGDADALAKALAEAGFERRGADWLRFAGCGVEIVELGLLDALGLPVAQREGLLRDAIPLAPGGRLSRPAPRHAILLLASKAAGEAELSARRRQRLDAAVAEDPAAWAQARDEARAWRLERQLTALERLANATGPAPRSAPRRAAGAAWRRLRPAHGAVIALSGLDGAGKSTQAAALCETLRRLGYEAEIEWTRVGWNEDFWRRVEPVKRALLRLSALLGRTAAAPQPGSDVPGDEPTPPAAADAPADAVQGLRQRVPLLNELWVAIIALDNARAHRRLVQPHLRAGRIVISDRYVLDSIASLRYVYGDDRRFALQRRLLRSLSPRPLRAYLLDVPAEVAYARKGEHGLRWLRRHRELYHEELATLGVRRLDGERDPEDLCAEIARDVLDALERRRRSGG